MKYVIARCVLAIEGFRVTWEWFQLGAFMHLEELVMQIK